MDTGTFISFLALAGTAVGLLYQHFGVVVAIREQIAVTRERLTAVETKTDLFWRVVETTIPKMLKSYPTHLDKDVLLDKFSRRELDYEEAARLRTILLCEMETVEPNPNTIAYVLVLSRLEQIIDLGLTTRKDTTHAFFQPSGR